MFNFKQFFIEQWNRRVQTDFGGCDVYVNPDKEELMQAVEEDWELKGREHPRDRTNDVWTGAVRGLLMTNGDIYIWSENVVSHKDMARKVVNDPHDILVAFYLARSNKGKLELSTS